jgi:transforming growth factor-beta-induced protein
MLHLSFRSAVVACGGAEAKPAQEPTTAGTIAKSDIVDTAANAGSFKTLVAAVKAADLESTLRGPGPFTVFAPTDEAFAKLPAGTVESLLKPENKDKLKAILTYHVVSGNVGSAAAMKLTTAKTVSGKELKLDASSGSLHVGKATVTKADIASSNGVIHVIDTVLLPE